MLRNRGRTATLRFGSGVCPMPMQGHSPNRPPPAGLDDLGASATLHRIVSGEWSAREAIEECLAAIDARDSLINAVVAVNARAARNRADMLDQERARGRPLRRLHGVPVTSKGDLRSRGNANDMGRSGSVRNRSCPRLGGSRAALGARRRDPGQDKCARAPRGLGDPQPALRCDAESLGPGAQCRRILRGEAPPPWRPEWPAPISAPTKADPSACPRTIAESGA